jgi:hypothetical protein
MRSAMQRAIILFMLAVCGGPLTACGSGGGPSHSTHPPSAGATGASAGKPHSQAQAVAFARAVNLTSLDLPGFTVSTARETETAQEKRLQHSMLACAGSGGSGKGFAAESSKNFELKQQILDLGVSSEVSVADNPAVAAGELAAIRSSRVKGCFTRYLTQLFKGRQFGGGTVKGISIASGTPPAPGTAGGFGWRVTVPLAVHNLRVAFYLDILGFVDRSARVTLFSSGALRPFPAAIQQQLFSLLLNRAKENTP